MYDGISHKTMIKEYFGCNISDVADTVVVSPILDLKRFKEFADEVILEFSGWYDGMTVMKKGKRVTVIECRIGSPLAGDCILALEYAKCKTVIFSGSAGAINDSYEIGDMLAVSEAIIGEGFSRYHSDNFEEDCFGKLSAGDYELSDKLLSCIKKYEGIYGIKTYRGRIFTIDTILGESSAVFDYMKRKGCDAVEMEVSSVFTAAAKAGLKAAALIFISDLPLKSKSLFEGRDNREHEQHRRQRNEIPGILLDAAADL
ncbi:MAG: hypothetical protein ACOZCL_02590 [Bacillota bacterium]